MNKVFITILFSLAFFSNCIAQESTALELARRVADKVIRETSFGFELQPQKEQLGMQVINTKHLGLKPDQVAYAFRNATCVSDTSVYFALSSGDETSVWINKILIYKQTTRNVANPIEIAYGRFKQDTGFTAKLNKGINEVLIKTKANVVFLRPVLKSLDLDKAISFDSSGWMMAAFPVAGNHVLPEQEIQTHYNADGKMIAWQTAPIYSLPELVVNANATYKRDSYADWNYSNGATIWSMMALEDEKYTQFVKRYSYFILDNTSYLRWQYDSLYAYRGSFHRIFRQSMLDDSGTPALPLAEVYAKDASPELKQFLDPIASYVYEKQLRLPDGTFCRPEPINYTVWADDLFMSVPFLLRMAKSTGEQKYYDDAAKQVINFKKYLLNPKTGLYKHGWFSNTGQQSVAYWGRANGWVVWATAELLTWLPARHPQYKTILKQFQQHIGNIVRYQEADGMWHQLLDRKDSYKETSCTALFTLAIARGVRNGWLNDSYKKYAANGWNAVKTKIDADGTVHGICRGTEIGFDEKFYMDRQTIDHDPRGLGAVITAGIEMSKLYSLSESPDMDTSAVKLYRSSLQQKLVASPNNAANAKQLKLVNNYLLACSYYNDGSWSWAVKNTGNFTKRLYAAADMLKEIIADPSSALYYKSLYLRGRIYYWLNLEDSGFNPDTISHGHFKIVSAKYPGHQILKMYTGARIPFRTDTDITPVKGAPQWAVYQRQAMHRMLKIIHWWVNEKQTANGELGGKYGDDVEILRWWLPAILGADDSTATLGYTRLADGVWNSGILERGFAKKIDDVEHSAELFRDTHPGMFLIKYGDPEYVERCMISMQNFNDVWTGITHLGHRHFKSYYLSATQVQEEAPYGVDVPLNARAVLPGLWAAWYNQNPLLMKSFAEWCNGWIEDAAREENGKPAGVFPAAVTFKSDKIGGYAGTWYDAKLTYNYYRWESLGHISELYLHLIGMYGITKENHYLQPVKSLSQLMTDDKNNNQVDEQPGSMEWVKSKLSRSGNSMEKVFSMARKISGDKSYDRLVLKYSKPYNKYEINYDKKELLKGFDTLLNSLQYNFPMLTSEVKFTDRVYVPGSNLLSGMYTGHFGAGYEYPALVATWKNTGPDVSVFVRSGNNSSAHVSLFNAGNKKQVIMRTWMLEPGTYIIKEGLDEDDDGKADGAITERKLVFAERVNSIPIDLPSGKTWIVSIEQISADPLKSFNYADPALNADDIQVSGSTISARIHNIGNLDTKQLTIQLIVDGKIRDSVLIDSIESPADLHPRTKTVTFKWSLPSGNHTIRVNIKYPNPEITTLNNDAEKTITVISR